MVDVLDVNDNPPIFQSKSYSGRVSDVCVISHLYSCIVFGLWVPSHLLRNRVFHSRGRLSVGLCREWKLLITMWLQKTKDLHILYWWVVNDYYIFDICNRLPQNCINGECESPAVNEWNCILHLIYRCSSPDCCVNLTDAIGLLSWELCTLIMNKNLH